MQTMPLIINECIEPYMENLQKYIFGNILEKTASKSSSFWYFALITLDCMNIFFKTPEYWLKISIDKLMKHDFHVI